MRRFISHTEHEIFNVDVGTYAATTSSVESVSESRRYQRAAVDIADCVALRQVFDGFAPEAVIHLAAESHVDRSIDAPQNFMKTNVLGTFNLLQAARDSAESRGMLDQFRFVHISTDEVFGSLAITGPKFDESTPYNPRSPYAASKAAADHLVRAWGETYGLNAIVINCSNNYGPFQFPEKLIPLMVVKALRGEKLPVYGTGTNIRDWLHVDDHAAAIEAALLHGAAGESYLIGGENERSNLEVIQAVCDLVDSMAGSLTSGERRRDLIEFVADRPGHDLRYAVDASKAKVRLGWQPVVNFEEGLEKTVRWYLDNELWWGPLLGGRYSGQRMGLPACGS